MNILAPSEILEKGRPAKYAIGEPFIRDQPVKSKGKVVGHIKYWYKYEMVDGKRKMVYIGPVEGRKRAKKEKRDKGIQSGTYDVRERRDPRRDPIRGADRGVEEVVKQYGEDGVQLVRPDLTKIPTTNYISEDIGRSLKSYQHDFVNNAMERFEEGYRSVMNFDGTGTGKTWQSLTLAETYLEHNPEKPVLITVPPGEKILQDFMGVAQKQKIDVQILRPGSEVSGPGVYITTYSSLPKVNVGDLGLHITDESHAMKNRTTSQATTTLNIAKKADNSAMFTATPMDKLQHIQYVCDHLNLKYAKVMKYLGYEYVKKPAPGGGVERVLEPRGSALERGMALDQVFQELTKLGLITKREKPLKGMDLKIVDVELSPELKTRYSRAVSAMQKAVEASEPRNKGFTTAQWMMRIRGLVEQAKVEHTLQAVRDAVSQGKQPVIFATRVNESVMKRKGWPYRDPKTGRFVKEGVEGSVPVGEFVYNLNKGTVKAIRDQLTKEGISFSTVYGSDPKARQSIAKFQSGETKVMITTPQSGGTGINLDDATGDAPRVPIIMTPPFSANEFVQMLGRTHRLTTKSRTEAVMLSSNTELDRWNKAIIGNKLTTLGSAVSGDFGSLDIQELEVLSNMGKDEAANYLRTKAKKNVTGAPATGSTKFVPQEHAITGRKALMKAATVFALFVKKQPRWIY